MWIPESKPLIATDIVRDVAKGDHLKLQCVQGNKFIKFHCHEIAKRVL